MSSYAESMGQAGRERVRRVLSWEHSAPVLLAAYDRLWPADDGGRVIDSEPPARPVNTVRVHRGA
jgi:hypothetical protein